MTNTPFAALWWLMYLARTRFSIVLPGKTSPEHDTGHQEFIAITP
jgi:hypothetical protein